MPHAGESGVNRLSKYTYWVYVGAFLFALAFHFLFRKHATDVSLLDWDNYTMSMVYYLGSTDIDHPYYSFFAQLLFLISGSLIEIPLVYLVSLLLLKVITLFALYLIYKHITPHGYEISLVVIIATFSILFFTIGGGGRFEFGQSAISGDMTLYIRSWSQLLLLFSLLFFFRRQYLCSSGLLALTCFFHLVNALNLYIVLLAGLFIAHNNGSRRTRDIIRFSVLVIAGVFLQMFFTSGLDLRELLTGSDVNSSIKEWYKYIYLQDGDDLSILYRLKDKVGLSYVLFQIAGLYLAAKTEGVRRFSVLLKHPVFSICFATYAYLIGAALVEWLQAPGFMLEKLIILQPRRIAYIPVLLLCYYIVRYAFEYFWIRKNTNVRYALTLIGFVIVYLSVIYFTNEEFSLSTKTTVILLIFPIIVIVGYGVFNQNIEQTSCRNILRNFFLLGAVVFVSISVRTAPFVTTGTINSIRSLYVSIEPRGYIDYYLIEKKLLDDRWPGGKEQFANAIISAAEWMKSNTTKTDVFLSIDFESDEIGHLAAFSGRNFIQSLNLRYYRGPGMGGGYFATHYDRQSYQIVRDYFESFLGTSISQVINLGRDAQLETIQQTVLSFTSSELKHKKSIYGSGINYILSKRQVPHLGPPLYSKIGIIIYNLKN